MYQAEACSLLANDINDKMNSVCCIPSRTLVPKSNFWLVKCYRDGVLVPNLLVSGHAGDRKTLHRHEKLKGRSSNKTNNTSTLRSSKKNHEQHSGRE